MAAVNPAGVPVLWFHASTLFRFWSKTFTKRCSNDFFTITWQINFFLAWVHWSHAFDFRKNINWKNINCFRFWWEIYTKCSTSNYVISLVKRLSSPALCDWSGAFNFRVWFGHGGENLDFDFVPLLFTSLTLFILSPVSAVAASCFNYIGFCRWF